MAATTFVPNGLLSAPNNGDSFGKPTGLLSKSGAGKPTLDDMEIESSSSSFVRTGLLSKSASQSQSQKDTFKPTGLLGAKVKSTIDEDDPFDDLDLDGTTILGGSVSASTSSFKLTGLLSTSTNGTQSIFIATNHADAHLVDDLSGPSRTTTSSAPSNTLVLPRASVRATTFDGKTVFIKRKPKTVNLRSSATPASDKLNLLDVPIHRLMDDLAAKVAAKESEREAGPSSSASRATTTAKEDNLWVERYRPQKFTDLIGNERVARDAMNWLKQWDKCVFGRTNGKKRKREGNENQNDVQDPHNRPREKILLISGPPGLGKTTLAHVVAKQAGYDVLEINASDARSGQIVDDRIRPALESGFAVRGTKPLLAIIDEIDGATGAGDNSSSFVHKLVQLTLDRPKKGKSQKSKSSPQAILRPIICICNDINASSLVKLRPHAYQLRIQKPSDIYTIKRLREICDVEKLRADSRALSTLVGIAKGDLRGCLNTLQFIQARSAEVTEPIVRAATKGMKEADASLMTVLNNLFIPLSKKRVKDLNEADSRYVSRLSHEIDSCGRESAIATGCFAHYATLRRHDPNFLRFEKANEWLMTFDYLSAAMYNEGDFALSPYLPYTLVPFYPLFQERGAPKIERNQDDWNNLQLTKTNEEIYKTLVRCLQHASTRHGGDFRHLVNTPILQLEFAPYINRIISPPLRPVNSQIVRPEERAVMNRLVDIMSTLEFRFVQERGDDGQLAYRLDPPVDVFMTYDGKRAADVTISRYAVRHLVAGEVDARISVRQGDFVVKDKPTKQKGANKALKDADENEDSLSPSKRTKTDVAIDIADRPPTDFFGRPINTSVNLGGTRSGFAKKYFVTYRYKEGNSAAVRKPVKMSAFL
ncbi:Chromosome transmission fidelity protein 18 [Stygiomarasmius scandens]|uniref:Chromosome transmission fidelity protein 18 n=1 Tax=Marasmiellus scandens TaxID=2682957 RepID=A0ABR1JV13_9AGAR